MLEIELLHNPEYDNYLSDNLLETSVQCTI